MSTLSVLQVRGSEQRSFSSGAQTLSARWGDLLPRHASLPARVGEGTL